MPIVNATQHWKLSVLRCCGGAKVINFPANLIPATDVPCRQPYGDRPTLTYWRIKNKFRNSTRFIAFSTPPYATHRTKEKWKFHWNSFDIIYFQFHIFRVTINFIFLSINIFIYFPLCYLFRFACPRSLSPSKPPIRTSEIVQTNRIYSQHADADVAGMGVWLLKAWMEFETPGKL